MAETTRQEHSKRRHGYWQAHVDACQKSGLTRASYCEQNGINLKTFAYWKHRLKRRNSPVKFIQVGPTHGLSMQSQSRATALKLIIDSRFAVEIAEGFNPATLVKLVEAVRRL